VKPSTAIAAIGQGGVGWLSPACCLAAAFCAATALSNRVVADDQSTGNATAHQVQITEGPQLEMATDSWVIIRWTTNNVRGTSLRYGMVHYGTDPHYLSQTAKSPNRWNGALPSMVFRVQLNHLNPGTTYFYRVESVDAKDISEGPESAVNQFTTPPPGERVVNLPQSQ
jgi:phosphodiesterase/alkaline phosphatase D-like protein